uniref:Uncharacterized protein n=1 Tax=Ficedula albicollis TaxID=59894 RepID=A0A803WGH2_FICAL
FPPFRSGNQPQIPDNSHANSHLFPSGNALLIPDKSYANSHLFPSGKASRWFGVSQSKSAKTSVNILQQEELIAQKKREIEARLEQQARQNSLSIPQLPLLGDDDGSENEASVSNKFVNDGSFLQQFLKLQKEKSNAGRSFLSQSKSGIPRNSVSFILHSETASNSSDNSGNALAQTPGFSGIILFPSSLRNCPKSLRKLQKCPSSKSWEEAAGAGPNLNAPGLEPFPSQIQNSQE